MSLPLLFSHYVVPDSLGVTPWTFARQAPLSLGFSRQGYWSGLSCSSPGDLPDPRVKPESLTSPDLAGGFSTTKATWGNPQMFEYFDFALEADEVDRIQLPLTFLLLLFGILP